MPTLEMIPERNAKPGTTAVVVRLHARKYLPYLAFALCASLYLFPFMRLLLYRSDEGILVEGAARTLHGQLLGRDFVEIIGPGTFYWLALFFKLFGVTFLASRVCLFVSSLGTALSLYFLSGRVCRSYQWLPCVLVFATYFGAVWPTISHHVDSNCFALLSIVCVVLWQDVPKDWLLVAAGALTGATVLVFLPKGVLLLLAILVWLGIQHFRRSVPFTALLWLTGGCVGVVALMLGYFWSQGALGDLIYANVVWPSHNYGPAFSVHYASFLLENFSLWVVPMQGINWTIGMAIILFIPCLFVAAIPFVLIILGVWHGIRSVEPEIVLYWLAGTALWLSEIHRKDICHLVFGSPLLIILCVFYLGARQKRAFSLMLQVLSITSVCLAAASLMIALIARPMTTRVGQVRTSVYDPVVSAIEDHVPPEREIFIYPYAPMYYFLSATTNPTRYAVAYYNFKVGSHSVFDEVIQTLDRRKVKYVLWDKSVQGKLQIRYPGLDHGQQLIIEPYLESHYRTVWSNDGILLMERNNDDHGN
jgi:hypothetical protein